MKTYKMTIKYAEDILDYDWGFEAKNQKEADKKASGWNRYHSHYDAPGYGFAIAVETTEQVTIKNNWVAIF